MRLESPPRGDALKHCTRRSHKANIWDTKVALPHVPWVMELKAKEAAKSEGA
jgi:hypothetical protein